jgi:hypothetical protein
MAKKQYVIDNIIKEGKIPHPTPDALWCKRCQRGMSGVPEAKDLKSGSDCPLCDALALDGEIAADARGILKTCQEITDDWQEKIRLNNRQREMKMLRSIKDTGDVALEKVDKQDKVIEELRKQIELLTKSNVKVDAKGIEVAEGKMTVGKIDTKAGSK